MDILRSFISGALLHFPKISVQMSHSYSYDPLYRLASATGTYKGTAPHHEQEATSLADRCAVRGHAQRRLRTRLYLSKGRWQEVPTRQCS